MLYYATLTLGAMHLTTQARTIGATAMTPAPPHRKISWQERFSLSVPDETSALHVHLWDRNSTSQEPIAACKVDLVSLPLDNTEIDTWTELSTSNRRKSGMQIHLQLIICPQPQHLSAMKLRQRKHLSRGSGPRRLPSSLLRSSGEIVAHGSPKQAAVTMPSAPSRDAIFSRWDIHGCQRLAGAEIEKAVRELYPGVFSASVVRSAYQSVDQSTGRVPEDSRGLGRAEFERLLQYLVYHFAVREHAPSGDVSSGSRSSRANPSELVICRTAKDFAHACEMAGMHMSALEASEQWKQLSRQLMRAQGDTSLSLQAFCAWAITCERKTTDGSNAETPTRMLVRRRLVPASLSPKTRKADNEQEVLLRLGSVLGFEVPSLVASPTTSATKPKRRQDAQALASRRRSGASKPARGAKRLSYDDAALRLQRILRGRLARRQGVNLSRLRRATITIQAVTRGRQGRWLATQLDTRRQNRMLAQRIADWVQSLEGGAESLSGADANVLTQFATTTGLPFLIEPSVVFRLFSEEKMRSDDVTDLAVETTFGSLFDSFAARSEKSSVRRRFEDGPLSSQDILAIALQEFRLDVSARQVESVCDLVGRIACPAQPLDPDRTVSLSDWQQALLVDRLARVRSWFRHSAREKVHSGNHPENWSALFRRHVPPSPHIMLLDFRFVEVRTVIGFTGTTGIRSNASFLWHQLFWRWERLRTAKQTERKGTAPWIFPRFAHLMN